MATVNVSNVSQLMTALNNATGDTTIVMASGNYDNLYISGNKIPELSNNADVTLVSANANNPATITSMILIGAKNVTFDGIEFDYTSASGAGVSHRPFMILSGDNITVKNSVFDGDLARGLSSLENGYGTGIALGVKDTNNLTIVNNTFTDFHKAVVVDNGNNIDVSYNDISAMASDGVNFAGTSNVMISYNHFHDFAAHPNTTAHKDMIQLWAQGNTAGASNVTIKGNILNSGSGTWTQSMLLKTENGTVFRDFVIEDNIIYNAFTHGITIDDLNGVVIRNNTVLQNPDSAPTQTGLYEPKIHIGGNVSNAKVTDNVTHAITGSNWSGSGNLIVQNTNPNQANYYGDLFVNALAGSTATLADLAPLPGGVIEQSGVGASISQFGGSSAFSSGGSGSSTSGSTSPTALLLSKEGAELNKGTVDFDISTITSGSGTLNTSGAKVYWDYGDGSTGSGLTASHHYTHAGTYTVKATVTLSNGTKVNAQKTINVDTPIALATDFQNGAGDQSDHVNAVSTSGAVQYVYDQGSRVAKLGDNGTITYARSAELFDNTAYTVMADFRKDNLSDEGKLISFTNSFVIQVKQGAIYASVTTDKGTQWISKNVSVNDTNWHKVALTFSSSKGTVDLYLDGQKIGGLTGLKGAVQVGNQRHDFHIGSNTGGSFDGLVDNVNFLTGDLSATQIQSLHNGSTTVSKLLGSMVNTAGSGSTTTTTTTAAPATTSTTTTTATDSGSNTSTPTTTSSSSNSSTSGQTAIEVNFDNGSYADASGGNGFTKSAVSITSFGGSKMVQMADRSVISYKDSPDLFDNKAYTVMADFRKDSLSDEGAVITFPGSFVIRVKKDALSISVTTDKGTKSIYTKASINDTDLHKLALTFDSSTGKAELFLDGTSVGVITGLSGATQTGNKAHDFHIGSPWGGSFDGMVDNVVFLTNDLSASEIKSIHNGSTTVSSAASTSSSTTTTTTTAAPTSTAATTSTSNVNGQAVIDVDFDASNYTDASGGNPVSAKSASITSYGGSKMVKLADKSVLTYKDSPDLFGNKSYTVMAEFRKDNLADEGKLITFVGSFVVQVKSDGLSVSVSTNKGTKWIHTKANVDDTKLHKVALTFDSATGKAELFLDGSSIGSITGLKGAIQAGNKSHDFHIGSPWGDSFDGFVDNVMFLTNDLSASEIKSIHNGTASIGSGSSSSGSTTTTTTTSTDSGSTSSGHFSYTMTARDTKVALDKAASPGIIDQAYLSGDTASSFNVKVIDTASTARFNNTLGVYEVDSKGNIVDVRVLDKDAQSGGNFNITGVDKGNDLGFFIIQDGYNRLDNSVLNSSNLSLVVQSGNVYLKNGSAVYKDKVFVSHDKSLNVDNHQHVTSMDNPNSTGAIITFEDQYKGGRQNDLNDVVFEVTAVGADELSFA